MPSITGLSRVDLERCLHLDDGDDKLIADRRRDYNKLGFVLQLVTVGYLGMFPAGSARCAG
ncbi:DUF4158 domain-containing protein [Nocardia sp. NPDC049707]|uniref:DUF4158 domain-containing protein n=1 Tax=Nocardia sp. NPDC049707 TaxID=3154735 RepID=UPI00341CE973